MCTAVGKVPLEVATCTAVAMLGNAMCMAAPPAGLEFAHDGFANQRHSRRELAAHSAHNQLRLAMSTAVTAPVAVATYTAVLPPVVAATCMAVTVTVAVATCMAVTVTAAAAMCTAVHPTAAPAMCTAAATVVLATYTAVRNVS